MRHFLLGRVRHHGGVLVVVSGLPGAGKSTVADAIGRGLGVPVLSVDPIEAAIWRSGISPSFETGLAAYEVVAAVAEHQLRLGMSAVADAVSSLEVARAMWRRAASAAGAPLRIIEVVCSDENLHRHRLARRERSLEGFGEPTWHDVIRRQAEYEPWQEERLILDSVRSEAANLADAFAYLEL